LDEKQVGKPIKESRRAISGEAYGEYNKFESFVPKIIPKTEEQKAKIKTKLLKCFMFSSLEGKDVEIVINAMEETKFKTGEYVIRQYADGDCLFLVESGKLKCSKKFKKDEDDKYLKTYIPGEAFGELALLYNTPRAASIQAEEDCILWKLDRDTFNRVVKGAAIAKREKYEKLINSMKIFNKMDNYDRMRLPDIFKEKEYKSGEVIIKEKDIGDLFYILLEGEAFATKTSKKSIFYLS